MDAKVRQQAIKRLRRAAGQIKGLERMVEKNTYCIPVLHQSMAAKEALSSFEDFILKNHLATHVAEQMRGRKKKMAVHEILSIYRLAKKK